MIGTKKHQYYPKAHTAVQSSICLFSLFVLLIQKETHWEMNSKQVEAPDGASDWCVDTLGVKRLQLLHLMSVLSVCSERSWRSCETLSFVVVLSAMCFVLCQVSSLFDSQLKILHISTKHLKLISKVCTETEKPSACVIVYTLTKCFGIMSAQQICKHCQCVWFGAANWSSKFEQQRFDYCELMN